jgi:hypothetical protein
MKKLNDLRFFALIISALFLPSPYLIAECASADGINNCQGQYWCSQQDQNEPGYPINGGCALLHNGIYPCWPWWVKVQADAADIVGACPYFELWSQIKCPTGGVSAIQCNGAFCTPLTQVPFCSSSISKKDLKNLPINRPDVEP